MDLGVQMTVQLHARARTAMRLGGTGRLRYRDNYQAERHGNGEQPRSEHIAPACVGFLAVLV